MTTFPFLRGRAWLLAAAIAVSLVALGLNAAAALGADEPAEKVVSPRTVTPAHAPQFGPLALLTDLEVEAEAPPSIDDGQLDRPPEILSDGGPAPGLLAAPLASTGSFALLQTMQGATLAGEGCNCQPPDTQLAVGMNEVVEAVNNDILVFDRDGTELASFPATTIFQPPGQTVGLTDPKILYDPTVNLYYATYMVCEDAGCGANNWSHMGISLAVTDNPLGSWWVYDYINDGQELQDQEKLGFSSDKITFAVNQYGCKCGSGSQYRQENVVVMQKSDAVAKDPLSFVVASFTFNSTDDREFDWMPTTPLNASTSNSTQYVVWNQERSSGNEIGIMRITGTPDGGNVDFSDITRIGIAGTTSPPAGVQPGGTVAGDKANFQSAIVQGNELWAIGTDGCTPQGDSTTRACTRLVEVSLSSDSIVEDFDVGTQGTYRYMPSVSKDGSGHLFFGFTISSASLYPTAALDASALPPPAVLQRINFASGDATYTGSRWGDYSGTQQDPRNTNDVWTAQEFGACATGCSSGSGNWATQLGQFTFEEPHITSISPNHGPATGGTNVDIYGSEFANGGTTVKFGSSAASSITWIDSTHIRAVSPPGNSGTVDIVVSTGAGTSDNSSADDFTYNPVLQSVTPPNGPDTGGQSVTILGAGLNGATSVSFGGTSAVSFTAVNPGRIDAVTPAHVGGTVDLKVTTSGGGTSNAIPYTFQFTTMTEVTSSATPSIVGASVTFTATVSPVPNGGTVSFTDNTDPIAGCQSIPVNLSGQATCTVTYAGVGSHTISANYSGNFFYLPSTSAPFDQLVTYAIVALYDQTLPRHSNATVPIKVALQDAFGLNVSSPAIVLSVSGLSPSPAPGDPPGGMFTYTEFDAGPGYLLNVRARRYPAATYTLSFTATGDPVTHIVEFVIFK